MGTIWTPEVEFTEIPKYQTLLAALQRDIETGALDAGEKLPPVRNLAFDIGVTPGTVARAYKEGIALGLLQAETGRGTFVATPQTPPVPVYAKPDIIDLRQSDTLDVGQDTIFAQIHAELGKLPIQQSYLYPSRQPSKQLNRLIADWIHSQGVDADPRQIVQTYGGQSALMLSALSIYQATGCPIVIDALIYPGLRMGLQALGIPLIGVEIDEQGVLPDALRDIAKTQKIGALMTSCNVLNPTLGYMGLERRRALVAVARDFDFQLVEDDCWGLAPSAEPSLHALAPERGWYLSSLTKSVAAGLRFGFLVAPDDYYGRVRDIGARLSYGISSTLSDFVHELLSSGQAEAIKNKVLDRVSARVATTVNILGAFDVVWRNDVPFVWLRLPRGWRSSSFVAACERHKIRVRAADEFALGDGAAPSAVRISVCVNIDEDSFTEALRDIARLLANPPEVVGS